MAGAATTLVLWFAGVIEARDGGAASLPVEEVRRVKRSFVLVLQLMRWESSHKDDWLCRWQSLTRQQRLTFRAFVQVSRLGGWGYVLCIVLCVVGPTLFVPTSLLALAAGYAYESTAIGFAIAWPALSAGALVSFAVARSFAVAPRVRSGLGHSDVLLALMQMNSAHATQAAFYLRPGIAFPGTLVTYALAQSEVDLWQFSLATALGLAPVAAAFARAGAACAGLLRLQMLRDMMRSCGRALEAAEALELAGGDACGGVYADTVPCEGLGAACFDVGACLDARKADGTCEDPAPCDPAPPAALYRREGASCLDPASTAPSAGREQCMWPLAFGGEGGGHDFLLANATADACCLQTADAQGWAAGGGADVGAFRCDMDDVVSFAVDLGCGDWRDACAGEWWLAIASDVVREGFATRLGASAAECEARSLAAAVAAAVRGHSDAERAHARLCLSELYHETKFDRAMVPLSIFLGFFVSGLFVLHYLRKHGVLRVHYNADRQMELRVADARQQTSNPLFYYDERPSERRPSTDKRTFHGVDRL